MSKTFLEDIPEFLEIQRNSFLRVLDTGLIQALEKINPIVSTSQPECGLLFYPKEYVLVLPENTITEAFLQGKTYGCKIYVPAILYEKERKTLSNSKSFLQNRLFSGSQKTLFPLKKKEEEQKSTFNTKEQKKIQSKFTALKRTLGSTLWPLVSANAWPRTWPLFYKKLKTKEIKHNIFQGDINEVSKDFLLIGDKGITNKSCFSTLFISIGCADFVNQKILGAKIKGPWALEAVNNKVSTPCKSLALAALVRSKAGVSSQSSGLSKNQHHKIKLRNILNFGLSSLSFGHFLKSVMYNSTLFKSFNVNTLKANPQVLLKKEAVEAEQQKSLNKKGQIPFGLSQSSAYLTENKNVNSYIINIQKKSINTKKHTEKSELLLKKSVQGPAVVSDLTSHEGSNDLCFANLAKEGGYFARSLARRRLPPHYGGVRINSKQSLGFRSQSWWRYAAKSHREAFLPRDGSASAQDFALLPNDSVMHSKGHGGVSASMHGAGAPTFMASEHKINALSQKEWVCIGILPLMTPRGHFIINGSHRIVVSQMGRAPGLYYQIGDKLQATIVPTKGAWLRMSVKENDNGEIKIWVRITPQRKIPYKIFIETYKYLENFKNSENPQFKFLNLTYKAINSKIKHFDKHYAIGVISGQIQRTLLNFSSYNLGALGRKRLNERLNIKEKKGYLTSKDISLIKDNLLKHLGQNPTTVFDDDIDHLQNRRVRTCGELLQSEIEVGMTRLKKTASKQLEDYANFSSSNIEKGSFQLKPKPYNHDFSPSTSSSLTSCAKEGLGSSLMLGEDKVGSAKEGKAHAQQLPASYAKGEASRIREQRENQSDKKEKYAKSSFSCVAKRDGEVPVVIPNIIVRNSVLNGSFSKTPINLKVNQKVCEDTIEPHLVFTQTMRQKAFGQKPFPLLVSVDSLRKNRALWAFSQNSFFRKGFDLQVHKNRQNLWSKPFLLGQSYHQQNKSFTTSAWLWSLRKQKKGPKQSRFFPLGHSLSWWRLRSSFSSLPKGFAEGDMLPKGFADVDLLSSVPLVQDSASTHEADVREHSTHSKPSSCEACVEGGTQSPLLLPCEACEAKHGSPTQDVGSSDKIKYQDLVTFGGKQHYSANLIGSLTLPFRIGANLINTRAETKALTRVQNEEELQKTLREVPKGSKNILRDQNVFLKKPQQNKWSPYKVISTKAFAGALREFFGSNPLSQYMDQTNPLAEITHKRRLSSLGPGGVDRASAGIAIRGIHPSHYGRICPIETPEGKNAGLVNSMTMWTRVNKDGFLETPYLKVRGGSTMSHTNTLSPNWFFVPTKKETRAFQDVQIPSISSSYSKAYPVSNSDFTPTDLKCVERGLDTFRSQHFGKNHQEVPSFQEHQGIRLAALEHNKTSPKPQSVAPVLSSSAEQSCQVATPISKMIKIVTSDLNISESSFLPNISLPTRDGAERSFERTKRAVVDFCGVSPTQNISVATSLIPFLEHDDATRALMGSNMQRQAVPLLKPKAPLVRTGLEGKVVGESGHALQAICSGVISTATRGLISIESFQTKICSDQKASPKESWSFLPHTYISTNHSLSFLKQSNYKNLFWSQPSYGAVATHGVFAPNSAVQVRQSFGVADIVQHDFSAMRLRLGDKVSEEYVRTNHRGAPKVDGPVVLNRDGHNFTTKFSIPEYLKTLTWRALQLSAFNNKKLQTPFYKYTPKSTEYPYKPSISPLHNKQRPLVYNKILLADSVNIFLASKKNQLRIRQRSWIASTNSQENGKDNTLLKSIRSNKVSELINQYNLILVNKQADTEKSGVEGQSPTPCVATASKIKKTFVFDTMYTFRKNLVTGNKDSWPRIITSPFGCYATKAFFCDNNTLKTFYRTSPLLERKTKTQKLQDYTRSNQATICVQRPAVKAGDWVQKGDLVGDCSASVNGILSLGQNIVVAYLPMEGFNFEDAIVVSDRLVHEELYTSIHVQRVEFDMDAYVKKHIPKKIKIKKQKNYKTSGQDWITKNNPHLLQTEKELLNPLGIIKVGSWVGPGDVLVSKVVPVDRKIAPSRHLLLAVFQEKRSKTLDTDDTSLRVPKGIHGRVINVKVVGNGTAIALDRNRFLSKKTSSTKREKGFSLFSSVNKSHVIPITSPQSATTSSFLAPCYGKESLPRGAQQGSAKGAMLPSAPSSLSTASHAFLSTNSMRSTSTREHNAADKQHQGYAESSYQGARPFWPMDKAFVPLSWSLLPSIVKRGSALQGPFVSTLSPSCYATPLSKKLGLSTTTAADLIQPSTNGQSLSLSPIYRKPKADVVATPQTLLSRDFRTKYPSIVQHVKQNSAVGIINDNLQQFKKNTSETPGSPNRYSRAFTIAKKIAFFPSFESSTARNFDPANRIQFQLKNSDDKFFLQKDQSLTPVKDFVIESKNLSHTSTINSSLIKKNKKYNVKGLKTPATLQEKQMGTSYGVIRPNHQNNAVHARGVMQGETVREKHSSDGVRAPAHGPNTLSMLRVRSNSISHSQQNQGEYKIIQVRIYIAERKKLQVGDKMSGRHGNKGIVSTILPREDMPFLPDGTSVDMVLNPLGIPSRMNVGQVFECLLGLASSVCGESIGHTPFDEMYGPEASRSLVYLFLYFARLRSRTDWLFQPNFPGKTIAFDGRTGLPFEQWVTVGRAYMLKLIHMVDEKIHARSIGPRSLVTQQPVKGRARGGGQRLGEMELWALEGFGAAYTLQEILTLKSDDIKGRENVENSIIFSTTAKAHIPETFRMMLFELRCLCLNVELN